MRLKLLIVSLVATSTLAACADGEYTPGPPVSEDQIRCFGFEQTFTDPNASVTERSQARARFFEEDCVLRGGSFT
jgi:hypothetical protein